MQTTQTNKEIKKQIENNELRWYVLSVVSGQEELVVQNLKERVKKQWLGNEVADFMVPTINESSLKKGEKVIKQKKIYPWYVFVNSKMNDKIWYVVRNTPGVRLIVGAETHPIPLTENEYERMMQQMQESKERAELNIPFKQGDVVILKTGDFKGMQWVVRSIDPEKELAIVNIEMLGRMTPVAVSVDKIELTS
jgi:transcriptional antiterminator NusG